MFYRNVTNHKLLETFNLIGINYKYKFFQDLGLLDESLILI